MTIVKIDHPPEWRDGTRVLLLRERRKDGATHKTLVNRITHSVAEFDEALASLVATMRQGERVYASAAPRRVDVAINLFRARQLSAEVNNDVVNFYRKIVGRWASSLMQAQAQARKVWLIDCDGPQAHDQATDEISFVPGAMSGAYAYPTRSGHHLIVAPFNRTRVSAAVQAMIHVNPVMLWAYTREES